MPKGAWLVGCLLLWLECFSAMALATPPAKPSTHWDAASLWPQLQRCLQQHYPITPSLQASLRFQLSAKQQPSHWLWEGGSQPPVVESCSVAWLPPSIQSDTLPRIKQGEGMAFFVLRSVTGTLVKQQRKGVLIELQQQKEQWIAKEPLVAGQVLQGVQVQKKRLWLPWSPSLAGFSSAWQEGQWQLRQPLQAGQVVQPSHVQALPWVKARQGVNIELLLPASDATSPPLRVLLQGEALSDGEAGQRVQVKQWGFNERLFWGRVVAPNRVEVAP